jgi:hypothetical protein
MYGLVGTSPVAVPVSGQGFPWPFAGKTGPPQRICGGEPGAGASTVLSGIGLLPPVPSGYGSSIVRVASERPFGPMFRLVMLVFKKIEIVACGMA